MRQYFGYKEDGTLYSMEMVGGGFPVECDLENPDSKHPHAVWIRKEREKSDPEIIGFICYDCQCPQGGPGCDCHVKKKFNSLAVDNKLVEKSDLGVLVDGKEIAYKNGEATVYKNPGEKLILKLTGNTDDSIVMSMVGSISVYKLFPDIVSLSMTGGITEGLTLVAPGQGLTGTVVFNSAKFKRLKLYVKGFAE